LKNITIAIDAMGGDHGPSVVVPACVLVVKKYPHLTLLLVGNSEAIRASLKLHGFSSSSQIIIHNTTEVVNMDELPSHALRNKKNSSMRVAINLVKEGQAQAAVSAGNTGLA
jgi:phosphate acyltransferase